MAADRLPNGRWTKGKAPGPGRPSKAAEDNFLALIDSVVTDEDWKAVIRKALDQAKRGDSMARNWLTDRRFGKAKEKMEADVNGPALLIWDMDRNSKD